MKWRLIDKSKSKQPSGKYSDWKPMLADESAHLCVYCAISDAHYGGIRNFHVEHYRPKSRFKDLEHTYTNLFYACGICNTFKGNDWPDEPTKGGFDYVHYPDPSRTNYLSLFTVNIATAHLEGNNVAAKYIVEKLNLNRAQILRNRKMLLLSESLGDVRDKLHTASKGMENASDLRKIIDLMTEISQLFQEFWQSIPYESEEVSR